MAVPSRTQTFLVMYQTSTAINFATDGTFTMSYTTITTATSLVGAGINVVLVDALTGTETIIDSVPLTSVATPLTTRTATISIAAGSTSQFLKLVPKTTGLTTSPTLAGHCYFDNIVIQ